MSAPSDDRRNVLIEAMNTIERLQERVREAEGARHEPVAVIGIGCRFPGGVDGPDAYWRLLDQGRDAVVEVPRSRWKQEDFHSEDPDAPGTIRARAAGFLTHWDPDRFDAAFFGINPREAAAMDPQQRMLLEVAWEALEHAGIPADRVRNSRTGVFTGITLNEYAVRQLRHLGPEDIDAYSVTSCLPNYASGRISYQLGLQGPSIAVDSACSSSLVTTHLACQSLRTGESDLALASGTNLMLMPETSITMTRWGALAPDGRCKTFDASADGLGRGEGCGVVVLKRLADARRDGDRVWAVIRGTAVNQDGASSNFTAPNGLAQEAVIRTALERSGLGPDDIDYIEAHGTGTAIGDPIELEALAAAFGDRGAEHRLIVGSAKTNLGHTEAAAGVAGLIKSVLSLHHGRIPPHLHFHEMTPRISERASRVVVPTEGAAWPRPERPARAGVSAFGVSGTNAHVVLEAYDKGAERGERRPVAAAPTGADRRMPVLYPLCAASSPALTRTAREFAAWLEGEGRDTPLEDIGRTLAVHRTHLPERLVVSAADRAALVCALRAHADGVSVADAVFARARSATDAVWVFSGFGSQWAGMGRELLETQPEFAAVVDELEPVLREESGFGLRECLRSGEFGTVAQAQPVIYAVQVGLAAVWRSYGLRPAAVLGHSMGEVAAAVVAGALTPVDGARVMCRRSRLLEDHLLGKGVMALVELPADRVAARLVEHPGVTVAVHSSARSTVVAGDEAAVEALLARLTAEGLMAKRVKGALGAGHSPQVDSMMPLIRDALADVVPGVADVPVYGTALADPRDVPDFDARYWADNARNPVRFAGAVVAAAEDDHRIFLEVSPHPIVTQSVTETLADAGVADVVVTGTLRRDLPEQWTLLGALAALHTRGVRVDWSRLHPRGEPTTLPNIRWQHESHWYTSTGSGRSGRSAREADGHPLLGSGVRVPGSPAQHAWQTVVDTDRLPWLADHGTEGVPVLPGTAYCEMALAAAAQAFGVPAPDVGVDDVDYLSVLPIGEPVTLTTVLTEETPGTGRVEITSRDASGRSLVHARARVRGREHGQGQGQGPRPDRPVHDLAALTELHPLRRDSAELYARLRAAGQHHGPAFAGVREVFTATMDGGGDSALGTVALPAGARRGGRGLHLHPALFDACMQVLGATPAAVAALAANDDEGGVLLPVAIDALRVWGDPDTGVLCRAVAREAAAIDASDAAVIGAVELLDADGAVVVQASGIRLTWLRRADTAADVTGLFHELAWHSAPLPRPDALPAGPLLLLVEDPADSMVVALRERIGEQNNVVVLPVDAPQAATAAADPATAAAVLVLPSRDHDDALRERDPDAALALAQRRVADLTELARRLATGGRGRLWVAARAAHALTDTEPVAPEQAALRGVVRTLGWEHPQLRATLVDVGSGDPAQAAAALLAELAAATDEDDVAHRGGVRSVARLVAAPHRRGGLPLRPLVDGHSAFRLESTQPGVVDSVRPVYRERVGLRPGEVEIRVEAAGVNFSDVLKSMGWYRLPEGDHRELHLGGECAGTVAGVGPGVEGIDVGDRVVAIAFHSFASHVVTRHELVVPLPHGLEMAAAAALPTAYGTAWYSLVDVGRLAAGESVLVHSASGGVGLAAVAVARARGAHVYATAGSEAKRRFLRELGVSHIMDSRSLDWADEIRALTDGAGVDVVLNSLTGEAIRRGLACLAPGGRFVELGKRDIHEDMRLGLLPFAGALTLAAVDFDLLCRTKPAVVGRILRESVEAVADGRLDRLPTTVFALDRTVDALRTMAAAEHIGKLVVDLDKGPVEAVTRPENEPFVRPDGAYVISGGLTGVGLATARRLGGLGAGALVLNGRNAPGPQATSVIEELRAAGVRVDVVLGDVAAPGTAQRLVAAAGAGGLRLRGVIHSAAALDDATVLAQTPEQLRRVWWPKAVGAWRLHEAAQGDLDWWVGFSSTASLLGAPGQSNYAAACAYLDGLVQLRRARGLPALSIDWGPWAGVGSGQDLADLGYRMISPPTGLAALQALVAQGRTRTGVLDFDAREWFAASPAAAGSPVYALARTTGDGKAADPERLAARLAAAAPGPVRRRLLEDHVGELVRAVLRLGRTPVDPSAPLGALGIDSLTALELRNRLEGDLDLKLPATLMWAHPNLSALADNLAERLGLGLDAPVDEPDPQHSSHDDDLMAQILLAAELDAADGTSEESAR
ncbi:type I polyketide synthase [Streptomyces sp. SID3343]|uniref:type I polyketide synthase n=1 Tax=Streptomyces sp. SID3343 TaxID=2690260 RepID=UPI00136A4B5B|nr:type I polyketide synthase [Streptomyces sp. SID3343]MYV98407.1 SDR family NAD(P)-dependent oxidoreductase [Streptomyces sp. SID3343]